MNKKIKIQVVDRRNEERKIYEASIPFNEWGTEIGLITEYFSWKWDAQQHKPDLILCHLNDLTDSFLKPQFDYIMKMVGHRIPVVLYSGGQILQESYCFIQDNKEWKFDKNLITELICFKSNVNSPTDLNLIPALEYFVNNQEDFKGFFNIILNFNPKLEAKLEFLHKCLVEKQLELPKNLSIDEDAKTAYEALPELKDESDYTKLQDFANKLLDQSK